MSPIPTSASGNSWLRRHAARHALVAFQALLIVPLLVVGLFLLRPAERHADLQPAAFGMNTQGALLNLSFTNPLPKPLTAAAAQAAWSTPAARLTSMTVFPQNSMVEGGNERNRFLVRKFTRGSFNTPNKALRNTAVLRWTLSEPRQELYLAYRVKTSKGFQQGRGGKLPGLCGGTCPTGGTSPWSPAGPAGFSARAMWNKSGGFSEYLYWAEQPGQYGTGLPLRKNGSGPAFNDGEWHIIQQHVRLNDPGKHNGVLRVSIDGKVFFSQFNLRFRDDYSFGIDTLVFSNFFGGHDPSWASPIDQRIYFDDIVLSPNQVVREW